MYITNKDLETLRKMQGIVWYLELNEEDKKIYSDFVDLVDKLEAIKKMKNIKNTKRIAEKRKADPFYARRNTEKIKSSERIRRNEYINIILELQEEVRKLADANYNYYSLSEYESVVCDINNYQDNEFEDFKTDKDFKDYIKYLRKLTKGTTTDAKEQ